MSGGPTSGDPRRGGVLQEQSEPRALTVFVPAESAHLLAGVASGSAIVGGHLPAVAGWVCIDYEGDIYSSETLGRFANRANIAAGRHLENYPTIARRQVGRSELIAVGEFDTLSGAVQLSGPRERELLCRWLGAEDLSEDELQAEGMRFEMRREVLEGLRSPDPARRHLAEHLRRRYDIET